MKKKLQMIFFLSLSILILAGWGEKKVELLNSTKLIDLSKAIDYAKPGGDIQKNEGDEGQSAEEVEETEQAEMEETEEIEKKEKIIVISVRGKNISYDGRPFEEGKNLSEKIASDHKDNVSFKLVDDWADAQKYREVMGILSDLHSKIGIDYTYD